MMINWIDKRAMPYLEYDFSLSITRNDKGKIRAGDKYIFKLIIRHGLEEKITSNGLIKLGLDPDRDRIYFAQADKRYYGFKYKYANGACVLTTTSRVFEYYHKHKASGHYMANVDPENGLIYIDLKKKKGNR